MRHSNLTAAQAAKLISKKGKLYVTISGSEISVAVEKIDMLDALKTDTEQMLRWDVVVFDTGAMLIEPSM